MTDQNSELRTVLTQCCASDRWVAEMESRWPFDSRELMEQAAADIWWSLDEADWRAAFAAHPEIGDLESLRASFADTRAMAAGEQSAVAEAAEETIRELASANREYRERFGSIFIVCATGKTAAEMLSILRSRLDNDPAVEIRIAAAEQLKITQLRLQKIEP
ncbi:MAG TPA: 2-oxo-4-hydroxy-4-carboxy-5-ureidoimidazoline decarboxylase [Pirellulales bacterium]|nr:2-oxo-4-hydroxy-4-carboxy-5-ureidoimidazoline decarboxylase [Pirellulales bacterium]